MDPSGRFVHGSIAASKPYPKDARYFMNFINFRSRKLNFINRLMYFICIFARTLLVALNF